VGEFRVDAAANIGVEGFDVVRHVLGADAIEEADCLDLVVKCLLLVAWDLAADGPEPVEHCLEGGQMHPSPGVAVPGVVRLAVESRALDVSVKFSDLGGGPGPVGSE
jgi:hypothetical protein